MIPLNPAQKWLLAEGVHPLNSVMQVSISFGELMDKTRLESVWAEIFQSHPAFRVRFNGDSSFHQSLSEFNKQQWIDLDWSSTPPAEVGAKWHGLLESDAKTPFPTDGSVLSRIHLITLPNQSHHLLWSFSEMLVDRESVFSILRELLQRYDGKEVSVEQDDAWQHFAELKESSSTVKDVTDSRLITSSSLAPTTAKEGASRWEQTYLLNPDRIQTITDCADTLHISPVSVIEAGWAVVIARMLGSEEIVYTRHQTARGVVVREDAIGLFSSPVPIQTRLDDGAKSGDWMRSFASHEKSASFPAPSSDHAPQALTSISYFGMRRDEEITHDPRWVRLDARILPSVSSRNLRAEWTGGLDKPIIFSSLEDCFPVVRYNELVAYFENALDALTKNTSRLLWDVGILSRQQHTAILEKSCGAHAFSNGTLLDILTANHDERVAHPAVMIGNESLSYGELDDYASRFATFLKDSGVQKGDSVMLGLQVTSWYWVALLGVLKLGATAIPVASSMELSPENQPLFSDVSVVVCDSATLKSSEVFAADGVRKLIAIDQNWHAIYEKKGLETPVSVSPDSPAIIFPIEKDAGNGIIYFSHRILANAARAIASRLRLRSSDRILQIGNSRHLGFYEKLFAAIHAGSTVILCDPAPSLQQFPTLLEEMEITVLYCDAATFDLWMSLPGQTACPPSLRVVATRDLLPSSRTLALWKANFSQNVELITFWTAAPLSTICLEIVETAEKFVASICDNTAAYILDGPRLAPDNAEGELVIGGSALAMRKSTEGQSKFTFEADSLTSVKDASRMRSGFRARRDGEGHITSDFPRYVAPVTQKTAPSAKSSVSAWAEKGKKSASASRSDFSEESIKAAPRNHEIKIVKGIHWLREAEGKPALFLIHPAKDGLEIYDDLLDYLPGDLPCAVLTPSLLLKDELLYVETLANRYVETLQSFGGGGSWHVAAYGNGAWIAWEMAQILAMQNREFATFAVLDAIPPRPAGFKGLMQRGLSFARKKDANLLVSGEDPEWCLSYRAFEGPAKVHLLTQPGAGSRGWKDFAPSVLPHEMKTPGEDLLKEPQVKFVADFISNRLRRTRAKI
ncbi:MAG: AMP-binding protein [Chthoniobacterales bacterium]